MLLTVAVGLCVIQAGDTVRRLKLADTLEQIASNGSQEFYSGAIARSIVEEVHPVGGGGKAREVYRIERWREREEGREEERRREKKGKERHRGEAVCTLISCPRLYIRVIKWPEHIQLLFCQLFLANSYTVASEKS